MTGPASFFTPPPTPCVSTGRDVPLLEDGTPLAVEVARRLARDAHRQIVVEAAEGTVGIGRKARTVPPWLGRLLRRRDGHCRFPGCDRRRGVQAHHLVHWADGGATTEHNLALLCHRHHQLVHDLGWTVTGDATTANGLTFHRPNAKPYQPTPAPVPPRLRHRYLDHEAAAGPDPPGPDPP